MHGEFIGFAQSPAALLEDVFQRVAEREMVTLPFFRPQIPVCACGFQCYESQWIGTMLTPWMLSLLVLPGPGQVWPCRRVGEKIALALPYGNMVFVVGELDGCGQYLAASLVSPLHHNVTAEQMQGLAIDSVRMVLSLPVAEVNAPDNFRRRAFRLTSRGRDCA